MSAAPIRVSIWVTPDNDPELYRYLEVHPHKRQERARLLCHDGLLMRQLISSGMGFALAEQKPSQIFTHAATSPPATPSMPTRNELTFASQGLFADPMEEE